MYHYNLKKVFSGGENGYRFCYVLFTLYISLSRVLLFKYRVLSVICYKVPFRNQVAVITLMFLIRIVKGSISFKNKFKSKRIPFLF